MAAGYKVTAEKGVDGYTLVRAHAPNGEHVGTAELWHHPDGHLVSDQVWVHADHRRRGIAGAMYEEAKRFTGKDIKPSTTQTGLGQMMWSGGMKKSEQRRVALVIAKRDGLVLFGRRRDNGKWTLPGGHLDEGEDPKDGARRELSEESGLEPAGELRLVDERELRGVKFYTFECDVDGAPSGKHDPDEECGVWGFFDISKGVPKDMAENLAGPKEPEKNIVLDMHGLAKALFAQTAYRHKKTGKVFPSGPVHDYGVAFSADDPDPELRQLATEGNNLDEYGFVKEPVVEAGFLDHAGNFYTRQEASTKAYGAGRTTGGDSDELRESGHLGKAEGCPQCGVQPDANGKVFHKARCGTYKDFVARVKADQEVKKQRIDHLASSAPVHVFNHKQYPEVQVMVHADTREPGRWRTTHFENGVPTGHSVHDTQHQALGHASSSGFDLSSPVPQEMWKSEGELAKSAMGNRDTFDPNEHDITKAELAKAEDDEVDRLLLHPNPIERRLALKTGGVAEKHLVRAFVDEDPEVQRLAIKHPQLAHHGLLALMQMPGRDHLQLLALHHPAIDREHVEALYHTHKDRPIRDKAPVMRAISDHHALDGGLIEKMVADGNGARVIDNLKTPPHVIQHVIEEHFLDPQHDGKRALARRALRHPAAPRDLVEEAFKNGPADVKLSVAMGPHLDEAHAQDVLQRGLLPQHDDEAYLRAAIVRNDRASKRHLETATKDRNAIVRQEAKRRLGDFGKFERDLAKWLGDKLVKATRPEDFRSIVSAVKDAGGRELVDHKAEAGAHPPGHNHDSEVYKQVVLDSPEPMKRVTKTAAKAGSGITSKTIFQVPAHHPTHGGVKFMVKPYHERPVTRLKTWAKHPHQGWAEMTNQALYHAAGIGDIHQRVHVAEHNMGEGHESEPALVVRMDKDMRPVAGVPFQSPLAYDSGVQDSARKVAIMDFLSNNLDRHGGNLLVSDGDRSRLTAIDHSRSFQYQNTHANKWSGRKSQPRELEDRFSDYVGKSILRYVAPIRHHQTAPDDYEALEQWAPVFDWWGQNSQKVRDTFSKRLDMIKDPDVRDHLRRNFNERADWLDDRAEHGLDNFGTDWYNDTVRTYRPGELTWREEDQRNLGPLFGAGR